MIGRACTNLMLMPTVISITEKQSIPYGVVVSFIFFVGGNLGALRIEKFFNLVASCFRDTRSLRLVIIISTKKTWWYGLLFADDGDSIITTHLFHRNEFPVPGGFICGQETTLIDTYPNNRINSYVMHIAHVLLSVVKIGHIWLVSINISVNLQRLRESYNSLTACEITLTNIRNTKKDHCNRNTTIPPCILM